jgi:hypothetical protein
VAVMLAGWINRHQQAVIAYQKEEIVDPASQRSRLRWPGHETGATRWGAQLLPPRSRMKVGRSSYGALRLPARLRLAQLREVPQNAALKSKDRNASTSVRSASDPSRGRAAPVPARILNRSIGQNTGVFVRRVASHAWRPARSHTYDRSRTDPDRNR